MNPFYKYALGAIALASASLASAQSVTLYGRVNLSVESQKADGQSMTVVQDNRSRWGIKASEDLGGGMSAAVQLEAGFNADTGKAKDASTFWNRRSEVDLSGGFGTLRLGNFFSEAYFATADFVSNHNHDTGTSSDAFYAYIGNNANKVAYRLPTLVQGLSIEVSDSVKETGSTNTYDLAVNYTNGGLNLGLGHEKAGAADQTAVRVFYVLGDFGVGGYWQHDKNAWGVNGGRSNLRFSAMYTLGSSEFHVNLGSAGKVGDLANSSARQWTLAYNYNLSKRTKVYAFYTSVDDGAAKVYGGDFRSLALGMRHNF